jgi:sugar O-acyltransferase (sialic acid O-acetyltransferase NeuD family)
VSAPVIIIGAGGHAAVVADALLACDVQVIGFTDTDSGRDGATIFGLPVLGDDSVLDHYDRRAVVLANGIGGSGSRACGHRGRRAAQVRLAHNGWQFTTVVHPGAVVSPRAQVAIGVQVFASAVIQARACIKEGCIVNTGAVAEHDVVLGEYSHLAPRAVVCGGVTIGADSHIGAGAVVKQGLNVGNGTVVGAGAVVVKDFAGGGVLVGVPARLLRQER